MKGASEHEALVLCDAPTDGVIRLCLNRPNVRNALNLALREQLAEKFQQLAADRNVRCVILTGGESVFAAGADVSEMAEAGTVEYMQRGIHLLLRHIAQFPKPLIAAVNGYALGGGLELALHADIIVTGEKAKLGFPEVRLGIMPSGGGTQRLVRAVGKYRAMQLLMTGEPISAQRAWDMGLVSEVLADNKVQDRAVELGMQLAEGAPLALEQIKEVTIGGQDGSLELGLALERKSLQILFASADKHEGFAAFLDKRSPRWQGR